jgi:hypothetical protein
MYYKEVDTSSLLLSDAGKPMWKIKRSLSKPKVAKHIEVYALQFADKPMWLERVSEDGSGDSVPPSVAQSQVISNQSLQSEPN